jgi:hypothetical protein
VKEGVQGGDGGPEAYYVLGGIAHDRGDRMIWDEQRRTVGGARGEGGRSYGHCQLGVGPCCEAKLEGVGRWWAASLGGGGGAWSSGG